MQEMFQLVADLGVTGAFLYYLYMRNGKQEKAMGKISDALSKVDENLESNNKILMRVAEKHGQGQDVDEIIKRKL